MPKGQGEEDTDADDDKGRDQRETRRTTNTGARPDDQASGRSYPLGREKLCFLLHGILRTGSSFERVLERRKDYREAG